MNKAIFLDRDGVIIENVDRYVRSWSDVSVLPGALEAICRLKTTPYKVIVVTNQSVVGRGIIPLSTALSIHDQLIEQIVKAGGRVDETFICPHTPEDQCDCRKPRPGLILQAASKFSLDLSQSILIGDALSDIQAGKNAGIGLSILVRSGRGADQLALPLARDLGSFPVYDRLSNVVDALLSGLLFVK